ncbi:DUF3854 domain-containing protein [Candidatus Synechococcus calcipolaris G9]|uniref:DUF3854 domain-containing protein n=1 Tax=Candidatus Synechococcus calcipolaris G9 TaxID=1497997 RepID=A0ABT6EVT1_9SYNE|nr:VapE domain-containing protein [Candidatus Synechococcus calcipolaris]MDG2989497.1 DUF3854 domain-containing protein [Candidatus Synechococcus calcipolaris G9]
MLHPNLLNPNHYQEWDDSAVRAAIISRNVWTIIDPLELDQLLNLNSDRRWKHSDHLVPGWAVAGVDPFTGEQWRQGAQYKPDTPPLRDGKPQKYLSSKGYETAPLFLDMGTDYWKKVLETKYPIVICEGAKKAGAILSTGIAAAISIPGVWNGQTKGEIKETLKPFCGVGFLVYLCFDNDLLTKTSVQAALDRLGRLISVFGAVVKVIEIPPGELKGIDDYLASFDDRSGEMQKLLDSAQPFEQWREPFQKQKLTQERCKLAQRYEQAQEILGDRLRLNLLTTELELHGKPFDLDELQIQLALQHDLHIPDAQVTKILTSIGKTNAYSPVKDYLDRVFDEFGQDSAGFIDNLSDRYFGTDKPIYNSYIRKTLIAAVARAYQPGCKVDTALILKGPQSIGKSEFFKRLASPPWFDDSLGNLSDKDERLKLHKVWFVEWAELESVFKRRDLASVKSFLTSTSDLIRPPYGRTVQRFDRASVIVGSTNQDEFLADSTGNRRFLIIPCHQRINADLLQAERDLIWASAVLAYREGAPHWLSNEEQEESNQITQDYLLKDPWEDVILSYARMAQYVTTGEILDNVIHLDLERRTRGDEMRISGILKANGWTPKRLGAKKMRVWERK